MPIYSPYVLKIAERKAGMDEDVDLTDEIAQHRELIRRGRALIAVTDRLVATSTDRLVESQKLLRSIDANWGNNLRFPLARALDASH